MKKWFIDEEYIYFSFESKSMSELLSESGRHRQLLVGEIKRSAISFVSLGKRMKSAVHEVWEFHERRNQIPELIGKIHL